MPDEVRSIIILVDLHFSEAKVDQWFMGSIKGLGLKISKTKLFPIKKSIGNFSTNMISNQSKQSLGVNMMCLRKYQELMTLILKIFSLSTRT